MRSTILTILLIVILMVVVFVFKDKLGIADALGLKSGEQDDVPGGEQPDDEQPEQTINPIDQGKWNESSIDDWNPNLPIETKNIPSDFDWVQYLKNNPDLLRAGIDTKKEAQRHFATNGILEDRTYTPNRELTDLQRTIKANVSRAKQDPETAIRKSTKYKAFNRSVGALNRKTRDRAFAREWWGTTNRHHKLQREEDNYDSKLRTYLSNNNISQAEYALVNDGYTSEGYKKLKKPIY